MDASKREHAQQITTEQAAEWFVSLRAGVPDAARRQEFVSWLRASPLHVEEYLAISRLNADMPGAAARSSRSLEALRATLDEVDVPSLPRYSSAAPPGGRKMLRLALAAAVLIAVGGVAWLGLGARGQQFSTVHGEQRTWQLADMSVVRLNSDSAVQVRIDRGKREIVLLRGQAYFEVARDPARPFSVRTGSSAIIALGTSFDVYERSADTVITVTDGRVAVAGSSASPPVELRAGDRAHVGVEGEVIRQDRVDIARATAWLRQEIAFDHQSIAVVVDEFNRYNRTQLEVTDARVREIPVSGVFRTYDVQSFVDFLDQLPHVRVAAMPGRTVVGYDLTR